MTLSIASGYPLIVRNGKPGPRPTKMLPDRCCNARPARVNPGYHPRPPCFYSHAARLHLPSSPRTSPPSSRTVAPTVEAPDDHRLDRRPGDFLPRPDGPAGRGRRDLLAPRTAMTSFGEDERAMEALTVPALGLLRRNLGSRRPSGSPPVPCSEPPRPGGGNRSPPSPSVPPRGGGSRAWHDRDEGTATTRDGEQAHSRTGSRPNRGRPQARPPLVFAA